MDFRSTCTVQAASALAGGVVLLVVPGVLLVIFGLGTAASTVLVARMLGGVLFALGATLIGVRDLASGPARTRVVVGNAACDACITVYLLAAASQGGLGRLGWLLALLFAVNAVSWLATLRAA